MRNIYLLLLGLSLFFSACNGDGKTYVQIETEFGNMKVELYDSTPQHKENFIKLVKDGFYDGLTFHRIIKGFMIQGGDPDSKDADINTPLGSGGPGYTIPAEIGAPHFKGTLAAARTGDGANPMKNSSGSQFYIVQGTAQSKERLESVSRSKGFAYNETQMQKYMQLGGTPQLDAAYTVFGEVVEGLDIIDKIAAVKTKGSDRPVEDVRMKIKML